MNSLPVMVPLVTVDAHWALTAVQRIAINASRSANDRSDAVFIATGTGLGRHLAARYPLGPVAIAQVASSLWITVLTHIGTFADQGDTEVASGHPLSGCVHANAVNEARDRAWVATRRNGILNRDQLIFTRIGDAVPSAAEEPPDAR